MLCVMEVSPLRDWIFVDAYGSTINMLSVDARESGRRQHDVVWNAWDAIRQQSIRVGRLMYI